MQKSEVAVLGGLTNSCEKKRSEKERKIYTHLNAGFQRIAKRDKKAFLSEECKEIEENNRIGKTIEISSRKLAISREHFIQGWI